MKRFSSDKPVAAVVDNIKQILSEKQIKIFTVFDHAQEAKQVGLVLPATQVIVFGDPKVGTFLMQEDNQVALDLPLKILVWEDKGQTWIGYHQPSLLGRSFQLAKHQGILDKMDGLMAKIAETAAQ
jgi:uncharacterized protein (DUF302 family)